LLQNILGDSRENPLEQKARVEKPTGGDRHSLRKKSEHVRQDRQAYRAQRGRQGRAGQPQEPFRVDRPLALGRAESSGAVAARQLFGHDRRLGRCGRDGGLL